MAARRMFAKSVIGSARFLKMPPSSRLLYYDLGMSADDDGVVEAFTVMRTTGAVEDDLRVLISKGFVTLLDANEMVAYIQDWTTNNQIRKDRYQPSIYQDLLVKIPMVHHVETVGQPVGNQRSTQYRLAKESIDEESKGEKRQADKPRAPRFTPPTLEEVQSYVSERHSAVDPQGFIDFYAAKGWLVGKSPMKDWRAACRNAESWERWAKQPNSNRIRTSNEYAREADFFG